jgi:leader peptidase (prepilin peptidase)/N-methyltransferase
VTPPWRDAAVALVAAPVIGSFLGTMVGRTAAGQGFVGGRSCCETCRHRLGPAELIPLVSYAIQRGRCRACGAPIRPFHLYIELAALLVPAAALLADEDGATLAAGCVLGWALLALGWIDSLTLRLPDALTMPLVLAGLAEALWLEPEAMTDRAWGAAIGYVSFRALAWGYRLLRGREGLGQGDAKLLAAAGAWVGAGMLAYVVLGAALAGLLFAGAMVLAGRRIDGSTRLPFGPFLAAGIWSVWLMTT